MSDRFTAYSFADYIVEARKNNPTFLDKINSLIDWKPIEEILKKRYKKVASADGRPAYPPLPMLWLLLLERWYNLRPLKKVLFHYLEPHTPYNPCLFKLFNPFFPQCLYYLFKSLQCCCPHLVCDYYEYKMAILELYTY